MAHPGREMLYLFDPELANGPSEYQKRALKAWADHRAEYHRYRFATAELEWVLGPDRVSVGLGGERHHSANHFLSITLEDHAIELDRIAVIYLEDDVRFLDGEIAHGRVLNRVVGLFETDRFRARPEPAEPRSACSTAQRRAPRRWPAACPRDSA